MCFVLELGDRAEGQFHGQQSMSSYSDMLSRDPRLAYCSAVAILKFIVMFGQTTPRFHFALGPAKHKARVGRDREV